MVVPLGDLYPFIKIAFIKIMAGIVVAILRPAVSFDAPRAAWRWWAPLAAAAVWFWFAELAPWTSTYNPGDIDVVLLIIGAVVTAISAGVGEELFYRRWLQTRVEALLGGWAGITIASFLFAIMHLGSHSSGDFITDLTRVIAFQGSMGLFLGLMWWRYRNLWAIILVHLLANGWGVAVFLVG